MGGHSDVIIDDLLWNTTQGEMGGWVRATTALKLIKKAARKGIAKGLHHCDRSEPLEKRHMEAFVKEIIGEAK